MSGSLKTKMNVVGCGILGLNFIRILHL